MATHPLMLQQAPNLPLDGRDSFLACSMPPNAAIPPEPKSESQDSSLSGNINIERSVTVEGIITEPRNSQNDAANVSDSGQNYQVIISAASQFARNMFSAPTLRNSNDSIAFAQTRPRNRQWIVTALLLILVNLACTVVDTMMPVQIPSIVFDFDVQGFHWLLAAPAIGAAASVLTAGQLYAVFAFNQIYLLSMVLFLTGTISPGFAPNMAFLFCTRIITGIGMAGQQFGTLTYLENNGTFTDKVRRDFFVGVSTTLGLILGPIYGASFAHRHRAWIWGYYAVFGVLTIMVAILVYFLPNKPDIVATAPWTYKETMAWSTRLVRVDIIGCFLSFIGILTLFISLNIAGVLMSWSNPYLYIPIGLGGLILVLFLAQQFAMVLNSPSTRLFPGQCLRHFKTATLFLLTFLTSGIFYTTLPYATLYQLLTRPNPSPILTALYLLFSFTGPHLIPTVIVPVYIGSGLITSYPVFLNYSIWSMITSVFILTGMTLLFINTPSFFPDSGGLPTVAKQFALVCIGFWSAVTMSLSHEIMDILQPPSGSNPRQKHPHHNRSYILFAKYLGVAVALTAAGSIFIHLGPPATLAAIKEMQAQGQAPDISPTKENALILLLGYSFIRQETSPALLTAIVTAIENTFAWSFIILLSFAALLCVASAGLLFHKAWKKESDFNMRDIGGVPQEWLPRGGRSGNTHTTLEEERGQTMELEEREDQMGRTTDHSVDVRER
ncbi:uncharacterized protein Z518_10307 [Rhinocladiella mackenziei CBS 650.93]|uniref:Major facilitator superfamily (MFS) profile domain-containing protein n=1 Tax=Rhinocladiella mackenziei CBS 650.93 TaxID=1442369 RepID=A0A0D2ITV3_9EURO|nr:uncharacterized protein Z518_10307 [Rhinocladiella mackenziei CBS 650.93]KIX00170.1 hypothetical protein Z518_10307 [Rhinocladiella mackenziei CBS 650.93]